MGLLPLQLGSRWDECPGEPQCLSQELLWRQLCFAADTAEPNDAKNEGEESESERNSPR